MKIINKGKKLRRIVIINQDSGYLMVDIVNEAAKDLNCISLITGRLIIRDKPLSSKTVVHKISEYKRNSSIARIASWTLGFLQILFIIKTKYRHDYILIITNPPIATFLPLFCSNGYSLMIFDVYPDTLTKSGIISEESWISRSWSKINHKIFKGADIIFTLSDGMARLLRRYAGIKEIKIVPVWSDNNFFKPVLKNANPFISKHGLEKKFVVLYSGNLGATHNVEILTELATLVKNPSIIFLIIGDGDRKQAISDEIHKMGLKNCLLLPLQPVDILPYSFASADLAIVSLGIRASEHSLPSKTFNFMSAGLPLLCIAGDDSELNALVKKYNNGCCFVPERKDEIVDFIEEMAINHDLFQHFRANSLKASNDFTPKNAKIVTEALIKLINTH